MVATRKAPDTPLRRALPQFSDLESVRELSLKVGAAALGISRSTIKRWRRATAPPPPPQAALCGPRIRALAYTGLPPGVLGQLSVGDVDWDAGIVRLPSRVKGEGVAAREIPLTMQGLDALRALDAVGGWHFGAQTITALNRSFKRAAAKAGVTGTSLYALRHSFGAELYRQTRDLATVGRFLGHAEGSPMTARYAMGANADVDRAAARKLGESFGRAQRQARRLTRPDITAVQGAHA
jgi:integrase